MATAPSKKPPDSSTQETVADRFQRLAAVWHEQTDYLSSMSEASSHAAYQDIIRLGPAVVPLLLRDLQDNHTHWFAALHAITGAQPIAKNISGSIPKMVEAWMRWAKNNGYQW